jgi:hypothetical protein
MLAKRKAHYTIPRNATRRSDNVPTILEAPFFEPGQQEDFADYNNKEGPITASRIGWNETTFTEFAGWKDHRR